MCNSNYTGSNTTYNSIHLDSDNRNRLCSVGRASTDDRVGCKTTYNSMEKAAHPTDPSHVLGQLGELNLRALEDSRQPLYRAIQALISELPR
jgi:hypothetical protein